MTECVEKQSVHNSVIALYTCANGTLTSVSGKHGKAVSMEWSALNPLLTLHSGDRQLGDVSQTPLDISHASDLPQLCTISQGQIIVFQVKLQNESQTRGLIYRGSTVSSFDLWFINHVLARSALGISQSTIVDPTISSKHTKAVTELFEQELRNVTVHDEWFKSGKLFFMKTVDFFTSRLLKIEACLPAFPCKSHNTSKVAGVLPDKGEELALRQLASFVEMVNKVYAPGIKIWIISDGHVFSDCSKYIVNQGGVCVLN